MLELSSCQYYLLSLLHMSIVAFVRFSLPSVCLPTVLTMSEKLALLPKDPGQSRPSSRPALVIHGGAGTFSKER